jgi:hypothetical protein
MTKKLFILTLLVVLTVVLVSGQAFAGTQAQAITPAPGQAGQQAQAQQVELARVGTVAVRLPLADESAKRFGPDAVIEDLPLCALSDGTLAVLVPRELDVFGQEHRVVSDRQVVNLSELHYSGGGWLALPFQIGLE